MDLMNFEKSLLKRMYNLRQSNSAKLKILRIVKMNFREWEICDHARLWGEDWGNEPVCVLSEVDRPRLGRVRTMLAQTIWISFQYMLFVLRDRGQYGPFKFSVGVYARAYKSFHMLFTFHIINSIAIATIHPWWRALLQDTCVSL